MNSNRNSIEANNTFVPCNTGELEQPHEVKQKSQWSQYPLLFNIKLHVAGLQTASTADQASPIDYIGLYNTVLPPYNIRNHALKQID